MTTLQAITLAIALLALGLQLRTLALQWLHRRAVRLGNEIIQREIKRRLREYDDHPIEIDRVPEIYTDSHCRIIRSREVNS